MTYNISEPIHKQIGIDESIALPYQQCINGLLIGRTINVISPGDFDRHIHKTVSKLLRIKEQQKVRFNAGTFKVSVE